MATNRPLNIAFVWNQHQPFYRDTVENEYIMPWSRLHACKDYYQMAAILEQYPSIRQTFNFTPSLLQQLEEYLQAGVKDYYMKVMKPVTNLTKAEKLFLLRHYFDIQWDNVIGRFPRYRELLDLQGRCVDPKLSAKAEAKYSLQDYQDLQVWFNLAWIDPELRDTNSYLRDLMSRGRDFTDEDRERIIEEQLDILKEVVPVHRRLKEKGQIEMMTTPYYHPIIPLIIDNYSSLRATPGLPLPERFSYSVDAHVQVNMSLEQYNRLFGGRPVGIWPPEQAVSPETVAVFSDGGFTWTISDEQILARSLDVEIIRDSYGHVLNPELLYQPYRVSGEGGEINMIFRDHVLSDRIGFEYQHFDGDGAAADVVHRLHKIRDNLGHTPGNFLVVISLDGENAWEWYPDDKRSFLHGLYRRISQDNLLQCVTVSEYLKKNPPRRSISHLFTGSWVDHNLARWIGAPNKNAMWNMLRKARIEVENYPIDSEKDEERVKEALNNIYIAEGSDYSWWVDSMPYHMATPFEALYRRHIAGVYDILGKKPPSELYKPLLVPGPGEASFENDPISGPSAMAPACSDKNGKG